uniref:Uncharacterized protein n=1 Tax=Anopheles minimus TaxID=112268 RepID=A0A182VUL6_9DIPT
MEDCWRITRTHSYTQVSATHYGHGTDLN